MSGMNFWMSIPGVPLAAGATKYVVRLTIGANHRALVNMIHVSFNGTGPNDDPVKVDWVKAASSGSATNSPAGGIQRKIDLGMSENISTTLGYNLGSAPSSPVLLKSWQVHPQGGMTIILPIDRPLIMPGGGFYFVRCNAPQAVDVIVTMWCEE